MELKSGYKQTEVGVIPEEWTVECLESLGEKNKPAIKAGPFGSSLTKDIYVADGYKVYGQEQVIRGDHTYGDYFISERKYKELESCAVSPGDILLSLVGTTGKTLVVPDNAAPGVINPRLLRFSFNRNKVCPIFFKELFGTHQFQGYLERHAQGGTMGVLNAGILRPVQIALPTLAEQRAIATALSDVDALLQGLEQLITKKRDIKQAAMQQLLTGKQRLPGFGGEWEVKPMKSLGFTYGGLSGKTKADFEGGNYPYIPFMNVMSDTVIDVEWLDYVCINREESQNKAEKGDLFFNGSSETPEEVGFCSVLLKEVPDLYLNSFCFGFRMHPTTKANGLFMAYWFRSSEGRKAMSLLAQGATRYNIAKSAFMQLCIPQPSHDEQTAIATVLSDMDAEITALEQQRDKTRELKQGMMQQLLTGQIRLV